jgi:hypothetical protein
MSAQGVGPIVALTFVAAIDDPARFRSSKGVGAHFGLTPKKYQSGETDVTGRISKIGDASVRSMLYEAANVKARIFRGDTHSEGSIFEPSTEVIRKGKASRPTEFGKLVKLTNSPTVVRKAHEAFAAKGA